jgi:hypothetical protein
VVKLFGSGFASLGFPDTPKSTRAFSANDAWRSKAAQEGIATRETVQTEMLKVEQPGISERRITS